MSLTAVSVVVDNALTASHGRTQALIVLVVDSQEWIPDAPSCVPRPDPTAHKDHA